MENKKLTSCIRNQEILLLPSDNKEMESYIKKNRITLAEQAISSIEFAIENNLPFVEVFGFNNTDYVITISEKDYLTNVDHIYKFYLDNEKYELCSRLVKLQSKLKHNDYDEKEIELSGGH